MLKKYIPLLLGIMCEIKTPYRNNNELISLTKNILRGLQE